MVSKTTGNGSAIGPVLSENSSVTCDEKVSRALVYVCSCRVFRQSASSLTFAEILEVSANPFPIVDQRPLRVEIRRRSVRQGPMIQMEELTIVSRSLWGAAVQEGSAEELVLDLAGQSAGGLALNLQLLVGVIV